MRLQKITVPDDDSFGGEPQTVSFPAGSTVVTGKAEPYTCTCGQSNWCKHVGQIMTHDLDAPLTGLAVLHQWIMIPLVPTLGVWQPVMVTRKIRDGFAIRASPPFEGQALLEWQGIDVQGVIGIVSPDEGRGSIRPMVISWLDMFEQKLACQSTSHTFKANRAYNTALEKNNARWLTANKWSQLWYNQCWTCHSALMEMMASMVPDSDGPGSRRF